LDGLAEESRYDRQSFIGPEDWQAWKDRRQSRTEERRGGLGRAGERRGGRWR
jgi:hypothetical protein